MDDIHLTAWDIGGAKEVRDYWSNYWQSAAGIVFVVDSADEKRIDESRIEL